tara:strand:+ start:1821 stop:2024 length:204 start_codon:yes stop_codon:yes gene_type:complete
MKIRKITAGFVIQEYDTERHRWMQQEFIAGDEVEWMSETGEVSDSVDSSYLPFLMVQPWPTTVKEEK